MLTSDCGWRSNETRRQLTHPSGAYAFIDPDPTTSGAIRCMGPWLPSDEQSERLLESLIVTVEVILKLGEYVVFGAYQDTPSSNRFRFEIEGFDYGFLPTISARSQILGKSHALTQKEWIVPFEQHKAGFHVTSLRQVQPLDEMVINPTTFDRDLKTLRRLRDGKDPTRSAILNIDVVGL